MIEKLDKLRKWTVPTFQKIYIEQFIFFNNG